MMPHNCVKTEPLLLVLSAFMSHMSSAIQWQGHQLSAITTAHSPAWSVGSCKVLFVESKPYYG